MNSEKFFSELERLKKSDDFDGIIKLCPKFFPEYSAFNAMQVAIRKKIRSLRKSKQSYDRELKQLYSICIYEHVVCQWSEEDDYDIGPIQADIAHKARMYKNLDYDYKKIGYEELDTLNKTDVKWLKDIWGEPESHHDPREKHAKEWDRYSAEAKKLFEKKQTDEHKHEFFEELLSIEEDLKDRLKDIRNDYKSELRSLGKTPSKGDLKRLKYWTREEILDVKKEFISDIKSHEKEYNNNFKSNTSFEKFFNPIFFDIDFKSDQPTEKPDSDYADYDRERDGSGFFGWFIILGIVGILLFLLLNGCASTPPGQFKKEELIWEEKIIQSNYQKVYRDLKSGFNKCLSPTGWTVESDLYSDIKEGEFNTTINNYFGPQTFLGTVRINSAGENLTKVRAGIARWHESHLLADGGPEHRKRWLKWASGNPDCA